jgi:hypothetical protein
VRPMLIYSMSVSVDGFIADRDGAFGWSVPSDELFRFHLDQVRAHCVSERKRRPVSRLGIRERYRSSSRRRVR